MVAFVIVFCLLRLFLNDLTRLLDVHYSALLDCYLLLVLVLVLKISSVQWKILNTLLSQFPYAISFLFIIQLLNIRGLDTTPGCDERKCFRGNGNGLYVVASKFS